MRTRPGRLQSTGRLRAKPEALVQRRVAKDDDRRHAALAAAGKAVPDERRADPPPLKRGEDSQRRERGGMDAISRRLDGQSGKEDVSDKVVTDDGDEAEEHVAVGMEPRDEICLGDAAERRAVHGADARGIERLLFPDGWRFAPRGSHGFTLADKEEPRLGW